MSHNPPTQGKAEKLAENLTLQAPEFVPDENKSAFSELGFFGFSRINLDEPKKSSSEE
jgi:hypothetical protein